MAIPGPRTNAIRRASGDHAGSQPATIRSTVLVAIRATTIALRPRGSGRTIARIAPSGDHTGYEKMLGPTGRSPLPSGRTTKTLVPRGVVRTKAMCLPLGDQLGNESSTVPAPAG